MENRTIVAILLVISAFLGLMGVMQNQQKEYNNSMHTAVVNYLGSNVEVVKLTVHEKDMAVATYIKDNRTCEAHIVNARTKPQLGIFGKVCTAN